MEMSASRLRGSFGFFLSGLFVGLPRLIYIKAGRAMNVNGSSGVELSSKWWLLALVYFLADLTVIALLSFIWTRRVGARSDSDHVPVRPSFLEILQVVISWHLTMLAFDYPVATKLESVGLGGLEVIIAIAFIATISPLIIRLFRTVHRGNVDARST